MDFVVLSSSRGTTFQAVIDRLKDGTLTARCLGLVTDREDRGCVEKAKAAGIDCIVVEAKKGELREDFDTRVNAAVYRLMNDNGTTAETTLIADMGWMWVHSNWFIKQWLHRIINVHPSLLPKYGGTGMYGDRVHKAVIDAGEKETGMTIHVIEEVVDGGKILLQKSCPVQAGDTPETLRMRVQELEKEWYPELLQMMEEGAVRL